MVISKPANRSNKVTKPRNDCSTIFHGSKLRRLNLLECAFCYSSKKIIKISSLPLHAQIKPNETRKPRSN